MAIDSVAIGLDEVAWIALAFAFAFVLGLAARTVGLPPLVGFLAAGFFLHSQGAAENRLIAVLSDLGITLLLFTVGLKLNVRTLARPQVWAVGGIHMATAIAALGSILVVLSFTAAVFFADVTFQTAFLLAFALSFSSTVFAVKVLEERSELASLHSRIAIGILLMQDIAAVVFLAVSARQIPSAWTLSLILLWPGKYLFHALLNRVGHGELLVLFGFVLAVSGAEIFKVVGLKGDLGAVVFGVLVANHAKAEELSKAMLSFKDLFLIGFFLSIGLSERATLETALIGVAITPLIFAKSALFFGLLTRFRLRARTALRASLNLMSYSEFGLIVAAIGAANGWIQSGWLVVIAVALSVSFAIAAAFNAAAETVYVRYRSLWRRFQQSDLIGDDRLLDLGGARIAVIGMGGVGTGTYDTLRQQFGDTVVGIDIDSVTVRAQRKLGRNVLHGDPADTDFWDRIEASHTLQLVMLALPKQSTTLAVLGRLSELPFSGRVAAIARFPDQAEELKSAGAHSVFNMYAEAGAGFVSHMTNELAPEDPGRPD